MKCLAVPDQKLSIVLMCVVPLTVPILRSVEYMRTSLGPVIKMHQFLQNILRLKALFYFNDI